MHILRALIVLAFFLSAALAADSPLSAVVSNRTERGFAVTASIRTNGCTLELWRYIKSRADMQGYWIQHVYVGEKHIFQIQHSATEKEQSLVIDQDTGYGVLQIDRDLDGKYEMFVVASLKDQSLVDVLFVADDGWLRHSSVEEFQERQRIGERNRKGFEELDKTIKDALKKANEDLNK